MAKIRARHEAQAKAEPIDFRTCEPLITEGGVVPDDVPPAKAVKGKAKKAE